MLHHTLIVSNPQVSFLILAAALVAVARLVAFSRQQRGAIRDLARRRGVQCVDRDDGRMEAKLDRHFGIAEAGYVRSFGQIRDVVSLPEGVLMRTVELLDLDPYGSVGNPHRARAAMVFSSATEITGIFLVGPDLSVQCIHPPFQDSRVERCRSLLSRASVPRPPRPLSLTLTEGYALAYLEPRVTGAVPVTHLEYLVGLAARLGDPTWQEG